MAVILCLTMDLCERGDFYGLPYSFYGPHIDEDKAAASLIICGKNAGSRLGIGTHTASLVWLFMKEKPYANGVYGWGFNRASGFI